MTACDYQTLAGLEGRLFNMILYTDEQKQIGTRTGVNTVRGYRCKLAFTYGLPPSESKSTAFKCDILFQEEYEFRNTVYTTPDYVFSNLLDFVPIGLNVKITTAYVAGTFTTVMKVTNRSTGLGHTGLAAADFEILESDVSPAPAQVISIVDNGLGSYNVLMKDSTSGTPLALASGEYYRMQVSDDDATYVTYLSNVIKETIA